MDYLHLDLLPPIILGNKPGRVSKEELSVAEIKENCRQRGGRFAFVDDLAPVRLLSRQEFDLLKQRNPRLIEMKAWDMVYLTEPPNKE